MEFKWQFIFNKNIEAKIEDELFLEKVRKRQISILAGDKINCELEIEYDLTERLEMIPKSEKYNIKKVNGEIIKPEEYNGTVASLIIFYFICHFWYKFQLFLA